MNKIIAYGLVFAIFLAGIGSLAIGLTTVFNPVDSSNVNMDRVSMDQLVAWMSSPKFAKWTNMEALEEYLAEKGVSLEDLQLKSLALTSREKLSLTGRSNVVKTFTPVSTEEGDAIHDIDCDLDTKELEFELTNIGNENWFLINQMLTESDGRETLGRKYLSEALVEAKPIQLYINNFPVNTLLPKFWFGERLFYEEGEYFADACKADFLRQGKTVDCKLEPVPVRTGILANHYLLITPSFREQGTFLCN